MATEKEAEALARKLLLQHELFEYDFAFNHRKRHLGVCHFATPSTRGRIELSRHFVELNDLVAVGDTLLHEIGHALCWKRHRHAGHGRQWKLVCAEIGARPERRGLARMPVCSLLATCSGC